MDGKERELGTRGDFDPLPSLSKTLKVRSGPQSLLSLDSSHWVPTRSSMHKDTVTHTASCDGRYGRSDRRCIRRVQELRGAQKRKTRTRSLTLAVCSVVEEDTICSPTHAAALS